jgi:predicted dehydrogenase
MRAGIIGCGLIGRKRARALPDKVELISCFDLDDVIAEQFAREFEITCASSVNELLNFNDIDFVVIATRHDSLGILAKEALKAGKHVFVEKPGAINRPELVEIFELSDKYNLKVHVGYNHRHHPAVSKAIEIVKSGSIGEVMFLRGRYGHGGRIGYEKEWRADKSKSGGGELIDQGSHLIDLSIGFLGNLQLDYAATPTYFWNMPVEDNAFISLRNKKGNIGFLQASCTEWKNLFSLEIYGKNGKLDIQGLGGSYGLETLTFHEMLPEMGPPLSSSWTFPEPDISWQVEIEEFVEDLISGSNKSDNLRSSIEVLRIIEEIYTRNYK